MRNFFNTLKYRLSIFMNGRYGADALFNFMLYTTVALITINMFFRNPVIILLEFVFLAISVFRMMSRNTAKRRAENEKFLKKIKGVKAFFKLQKDRVRDRKTHVYRRCPSFKAVLRLPKKKGKHTVKCPSCGTRFDVKI